MTERRDFRDDDAMLARLNELERDLVATRTWAHALRSAIEIMQDRIAPGEVTASIVAARALQLTAADFARQSVATPAQSSPTQDPSTPAPR